MGYVIRNRGGRRTAGAKGINGRVSEFILDRESKMFHEVATRLFLPVDVAEHWSQLKD